MSILLCHYRMKELILLLILLTIIVETIGLGPKCGSTADLESRAKRDVQHQQFNSDEDMPDYRPGMYSTVENTCMTNQGNTRSADCRYNDNISH